VLNEKNQAFCEIWAITFMVEANKRIRVELVPAQSRGEALHNFHECFRHGRYKIVNVGEVPEE